MKTDFCILWIDDNTQFVEPLLPQIRAWLEDQGFGLEVYPHKNGKDIFEDLRKRDIELIVLDYHLGKKNGDIVISDIRGKHFYQDIVFYSQGGLPDAEFKTPPDGVFFVDKLDAVARIKDLIGLKIKKASDIATMRGWIVADAIELELLLNAVISKFFAQPDDRFTKCVLQHEGLFDFYKKHMVANNLLHHMMDQLTTSTPQSPKVEKIKACKKILDGFSDEIVHIRNALAHQMVDTDLATGQKSIKAKGKTKLVLMTPEQCVKFRKDIRKHRANLIELAKLL